MRRRKSTSAIRVPFDQIADPRRLPRRLALAQGIAALVDLAPQLLGPLAGSRRGPFGPAPDGHPPLAPRDPVVQREGPVPGRGR